MPNTFYQMCAHAVFAVKYRKAMLAQEWRQQMFAVIGNLINEAGGKTYLVNGIEDHVHCAFGFKPSANISSIMKVAKGKSSKWLNEQHILPERFEWQEGFGSFTFMHHQKGAVCKYIERQEEHHRTVAFLDEYRHMLRVHEIPFDEQYIFHLPL